MEMNIRVEGAPEPLHDGHGTAPPVGHSVVARPGAGGSRGSRAGSAPAPRGRGCDPTRGETGGDGEDSGPIGGSAPGGRRGRRDGRRARPCGVPRSSDKTPAGDTRTAGADQTRTLGIEIAKPPLGQPQPRKSRNSCSTKLGRPSPSRRLAGLCPERLEVIAHDLVEDGRPRLSRFIGRRRGGHAPGEAQSPCRVTTTRKNKAVQPYALRTVKILTL